MKSFLCELFFSCLLATPAAKPVEELTYRSALFSYYQADYEQALVDVLVAERQQRIGDDPIRFELAKGSFAFQEGLHRYASETFDAVAAAELTDLDRMRLAFHLAREHYRRGDFAAMDAELAAVDLGANWLGRERRHPEVTFMRAEAALARGDFAAAGAHLDDLPDDDRYLAYGLFNLGVAQRAAGDAEASHAAFVRLGNLRPEDEETWDLVQRGRLALAVMARQTDDAVNAESMLGSLPGDGRYRDLALASYGKLAMAREDHELAARIWLTLLAQDGGWSRSHAMARIGLPMSLEQLATPAHALDRYREAEQAFEVRLASLGEAARNARDPAWIDRLLDVFAMPDDAARNRALGRIDGALGAQSWIEWLSGEDVHRVMVEWRELNDMARWLEALPATIESFQEITAERRRRAGAARRMLDDEALVGRRAELAGIVAGLESEIATLQREPARFEAAWMQTLANDEERALIAELDAMSTLIREHMPAADQPRFQARVDRLLGTLFWDIADTRSARIRELTRQLDDNRGLLADVDARIERLAEAEARFAAGVETDFVLLTDRAGDVSSRVAAALDDRRAVIAEALERGLEQERRQTEQYLLTARIAIARATDQLADAAPAAGGDS
ncbi:MAG: hypothetical protein CMD39_00525 [Gammaproteobacteria bacterium]|nr:hypothetical protein [Gammaproteobacteria bacterium]